MRPSSPAPSSSASSLTPLERPLRSIAAQGIATLLDAEKEASQIVAKARECASLCSRSPLSDLDLMVSRNVTDRNQRLKDARGEASKEIEQLRAKKEAEFKEFENQVSPNFFP